MILGNITHQIVDVFDFAFIESIRQFQLTARDVNLTQQLRMRVDYQPSGTDNANRFTFLNGERKYYNTVEFKWV
jgi:hypothetical protein